jgi:hypothetical protein
MRHSILSYRNFAPVNTTDSILPSRSRRAKTSNTRPEFLERGLLLACIAIVFAAMAFQEGKGLTSVHQRIASDLHKAELHAQ